MSSNKIEISIKDIPEIIKQLEEAGKEIERLNNIIKEAREYIEDVLEYEGKEYTRVIKETLIKILDKGE